MRPLLEQSNISLFEVFIDVSLVYPSAPAKMIIFFCMKGRDRTLPCTSSAVMYCTILVPLKIESGQRKFHGEKLVLSGLTYSDTITLGISISWPLSSRSKITHPFPYISHLWLIPSPVSPISKSHQYQKKVSMHKQPTRTVLSGTCSGCRSLLVP